MRGKSSGRPGAWRRWIVAGLLCWSALAGRAAAGSGAPPESPQEEPPPVEPLEPPPGEAAEHHQVPGEEGQPEAAAAPTLPEPEPDDTPWIESQRVTVQRGLGALIDGFDRFFGEDRQLDMESPSTRLKLRGFGRTSQEGAFTWGVALGVAVRLPRVERLLGNARLVLVGENAGTGQPAPPAGGEPPEGAPPPLALRDVAVNSPGRTGGRAELRFDVVRRGILLFDSGAGLTLAWPTVPFARFRAHVRVALFAGLVLRATEELFVEVGGRGFGTSTDLLLERFLGTSVRLRWEGHGVHAQHTRGVEWSSVAGLEWKAHRRTGVNWGVGAYGFGTPAPGLEAWRTWIGVRQDLWRGWVFAELEPELAWPRATGEPRRQVGSVTLRLEVVIEGRPSVVRAAGAGH